MGGTRLRKTLLGGVAAAAILTGACNITPAQAVEEMNWTGFYFGADVGYAVADFDGVHQNTRPVSAAHGDNIDGLITGFHLGYNHQINNFVVGVEADLMFPQLKDYQPGGNLTPGSNSVTGITDTMDLLGSIRGRLGFLVRDDLLVFTTGGIGIADAKHRVWGSDAASYADFNLNDVGVVFGGGMEWKPEAWYSLRFQGLYYVFNERKDTGASGIGSAAAGDYGKLQGAFSATVGISFDLQAVMTALK